MAINVTLNSTSYSIPSVSNDAWGQEVSNYLIALATGVLSKAGGAFTLTAEADFGANYGLKVAYLKSRGTVSTAGVLRLANDEGLAWRNAANDGNLILKANSSDLLEYNGVALGTVSTAQTFTNKTLTSPVLNGSLSGTAFLDEDAMTSNSAVAVPSQQSVKAYVDSTASTTASDAETYADAAVSTHAALTATHGVSGAIVGTSDTQTLTNKTISGSNNTISNIALASQVTGTLPVANGGTGQTTASAAINALVPSQTGNSGNVLATDGTNVSWSAALTSTLTDSYIFVGDGSNQAQGVAVSGDITLANDGTTAIASGVIVNADISTSAAIAGSKIDPDFDDQNVITDGFYSLQDGGTERLRIFAASASVEIASQNASVLRINRSGNNVTICEDGGSVAVGSSSARANYILDLDGDLVLGNSSNKVSIDGGGIAFNRDINTGALFDTGSFAFQWQHTTSGVGANSNLALQVYNTTPAVVTSNALAVNGLGRVGVGSASPTHQLYVEENRSSGHSAWFFNDGNNADRYGIGVQAGADDQTTGTHYYLDCYDGDGTNIGGIAHVSDTLSIYQFSDERLKTNIQDPTFSALSIVSNVPTRLFNKISNPNIEPTFGWIAQEVQQHIPKAVTEIREGYLAISRETMLPYLWKAIQEQQELIEQLTSRIAALEEAE